MPELAERFGVSHGHTKKIRKQQLRTGQMERPAYRAGRRRRVTPEMEAELRLWVQQRPDLTLQELQQRLQRNHSLRLSMGRLWLVLRQLKLPLKKTLHAQEPDTPENRQRREAWWEMGSRIEPERLVFLDESGATTEMTRRYGRAPSGERVREATPAGHWSTLTLLGAMSSQGRLASRTVESATDGEVFLAYLDQVLCPGLRPGPMVVMDNLAAHKVQGVPERMEAVGAQLLYLPRLTRPISTPSNSAGRR